MTGIRMGARGCAAALAVMFLSSDVHTSRAPASHTAKGATARTTAVHPQRARLIRLPDRPREEPVRALHTTAADAAAGLAAFLLLSAVWYARPRRPLAPTARQSVLQAGA